jgi:cytochrome c-type biogenesis protein CcmH/NrfG
MTLHAEKWADYGRQASLAGEHALAIQALEHALEEGANDASVWIALGIARAHERQTEGAIAAMQQALLLTPTAIDAWSMIGELAIELERFSLALQALTRCHDLDPLGASPHGARAKALVRKTWKRLVPAV